MRQKTPTANGIALPRGPAPLRDDEIPNPWVSSNGDVAHPDSPCGASGNGYSRLPGNVDGPGKQSYTIPHPCTLNGRNHILSVDEETVLEESKGPAAEKKDPPDTKVETFHRKIAKNKHHMAVDLTIKILNDLTNQTSVKAGSSAATGVVQDTMTAHFDWAEVGYDDQTMKVEAPLGTNTLKGLIELQIRYAPDVEPDQKSAYGRGTTVSDVAKGDITIGFHEHCHLDDWWAYLKSKKLPLEFEGKVGMTTTVYQQKQTDLKNKFQDFLDAGDAETLKNTDEVGNPTMTEYKSR